MKLYKASFLPVLVRGRDGSPEPAGRYIVYVTAPNAFRVEDVLKHFLPELYEEGYAIDEEVDVPAGTRAWSVSVGPSGRSYSIVVVAPSPEAAEVTLKTVVENLPILKRYVDINLYTSREIELDREGVW